MTYPGYIAGKQQQYFWTSPPYGAETWSPNPETGIPGPASTGVATDNQGHQSFQGPYVYNLTPSYQVFQFQCPNYNVGNWTQIFPQSGTTTITRIVSQNSNKTWQYTITKSGASNSGTLP